MTNEYVKLKQKKQKKNTVVTSVQDGGFQTAIFWCTAFGFKYIAYGGDIRCHGGWMPFQRCHSWIIYDVDSNKRGERSAGLLGDIAGTGSDLPIHPMPTMAQVGQSNLPTYTPFLADFTIHSLTSSSSPPPPPPPNSPTEHTSGGGRGGKGKP